MDIEKIIQEKKWQELSATEKIAVADLAATEEDYTLLKNMLTVAVEDMETVPVLNNAVLEQLQEAYATPVKKIFPYKKMAAIAAGFLIVALGTWFYLHQQNNKTTIAKNTVDKTVPQPEQKKLPIEPVAPNMDTTENTQNSITKQKTNTELLAVKKMKTQKLSKSNTKKINRLPNLVQDADMAINCSVKDNPELLDFITEVYE